MGEELIWEVWRLLQDLEQLSQAEIVQAAIGLDTPHRPGPNAPLDEYRRCCLRWAGSSRERFCQLKNALERVLGVRASASALAVRSVPQAVAASFQDRLAVREILLRLDGRVQEMELLHQLIECLEPLSSFSDEAGQLYDQACSRFWTRHLPATDRDALKEYALDLWNAPSDPDQPRPLLAFVQLLLKHASAREEFAGPLRTWLGAAVSCFEPESDAARSTHRRLAALAPVVQVVQEDIESFLLVELNPEGKGWRARVSLRNDGQWSFGCDEDNRRVDAADVEDLERQLKVLVARAVDWAEAQETTVQELHVELILPFCLLPLPVDQWEREDDPLGPTDRLGWDFRTVVRARERVMKSGLMKSVKERWERARDLGPICTCVESLDSTSTQGGAVAWVPGCAETASPSEFLRDNLSIVAAALYSPPPAALVPPKSPAHPTLGGLIKAGVPAILWTRHQPTPNCQEVCDLFLGSLCELPDRVRTFRAAVHAAVRDDPHHPAHHITLVWDHPGHLPHDRFRSAAG